MPAIDSALSDGRLLGAGLGPLNSWVTWLVVLRAAFGLPLDAIDRRVFHAVAGGREPPKQRVRELWCIAGRGSGKSRIAAAVSIYQALFVKHRLAPGERGMCLVIAGTVDQARVVYGYVRGFLEASPSLRHEVVAMTQLEVTLRNRVTIGVHPNSFRSIRGRTLIGCVFDETAFWRDESTATPDTEVYTAVLGGFRADGMLISISTPYRKLGLLHSKWRDHYGVDGGDTLVVQGSSKMFNPTLSSATIAAQRAADPTGAGAEWDAVFRDDIGAFLDDRSIDAAIDFARPLELPPRVGVIYRVFVDMGGGRHDRSTIAIMHAVGDGDGRHYVVDVLRGLAGDPHAAMREFVVLAKQYGCSTITGDNYGAEWVAGACREAGAEYQASKLVRSDLYLTGLPHFVRGVVSMPNLAPRIHELRLLERRTARSGRDSVDHGRNGSDDYANALFGALHLVSDTLSIYKQPETFGVFVHSQPRDFPNPGGAATPW